MSNPMFEEYLNKSAYAKGSGGGRNPHLRDGRYEVAIAKVTGEKKEAGFCVIPELYVLSAAAVRSDVTPNEVGTKFSIVWNYDKNPKTAPGNVQDFICAIDGLTPAKSPADGGDPARFAEFVENYKRLMGQILSPEQPGRGIKLRIETYRSVIKSGPNTGKDFIGPNWGHVPGQDVVDPVTGLDSVARLRKQLDELGV